MEGKGTRGNPTFDLDMNELGDKWSNPEIQTSNLPRGAEILPVIQVTTVVLNFVFCILSYFYLLSFFLSGPSIIQIIIK